MTLLSQSSVPIATEILQHKSSARQVGAATQINVEPFSQKMAQRLAMKTKEDCVCYVSYNVEPIGDTNTQMMCERAVLVKMKELGLLKQTPTVTATSHSQTQQQLQV